MAPLYRPSGNFTIVFIHLLGDYGLFDISFYLDVSYIFIL